MPLGYLLLMVALLEALTVPVTILLISISLWGSVLLLPQKIASLFFWLF